MFADLITESKLTGPSPVPELAFINDDVGTLSADMGAQLMKRVGTIKLLISLDFAITAGLIVFFFFDQGAHATPFTFMVALMLPLFVIFIPFLVSLQKKALQDFMQHFATLAGYSYALSAPIESVAGDIFSIGDGRTVKNVLTGTYKNK